MPVDSSVPPVEVTGLTVRYGGHTALAGVGFRLAQGVTGLLGPNGAGKTTLMRTVVTALEPSLGSVAVVGLEPRTAAQRRAIRSHIGYLPQNPGLYPHFTVAQFTEHIALLRKMTGRRQRRAEIERVLEAVGLADRAGRRVKTLSGGMKQRLALACAIVGDPAVLVLDEPTVGLDPEQRMRFRELIAELGRGRAVLLSTHQTDDVEALCGHVVVLDSGTVKFDGTPDRLASLADGRVWNSGSRDPGAKAAWLTGHGTYRNIGTPPPGAVTLAPSLEDGYLLLLDAAVRPEAHR